MLVTGFLTQPIYVVVVITALTCSVAAQSNAVSGKVVDRAGGQPPLAGVTVRFFDGGRESFPPAKTDSAGKYTKSDIGRGIRAFGIDYSKEGYASDCRDSVKNDVYSKELDTVALVHTGDASQNQELMTAVLEALIRCAAVSRDTGTAQSMVDTLRKLNGKLLESTLSNNTNIDASLKSFGIRTR